MSRFTEQEKNVLATAINAAAIVFGTPVDMQKISYKEAIILAILFGMRVGLRNAYIATLVSDYGIEVAEESYKRVFGERGEAFCQLLTTVPDSFALGVTEDLDKVTEQK